MKKSIFILFLLLQAFMANAQVKVTRVDPTDWYVGMKDASLQLMFYGNDLQGVEVSTDYAGVRVDSVVSLPNAHYLLAYLNLRDANQKREIHAQAA